MVSSFGRFISKVYGFVTSVYQIDVGSLVGYVWPSVRSNFYWGAGVVDGVGGNSERCLNWEWWMGVNLGIFPKTS